MNSGKTHTIGKNRCSNLCIRWKRSLRLAASTVPRSVLAIAFLSALFVMAGKPARAQLTVLYTFAGPDGATPDATLIADGNGNLYGTTYDGGAYGKGTVFEVTPSGVETVLHSFNWTDGGKPSGGLVRDAQGHLYGTTSLGGTGLCGTVFTVNPSGGESVLYNFLGGTDGCVPYGGLVRDVEGNLYGTTSSGGTYGYGTVFTITSRAERVEKVLYNFTGGADGGAPYCYPSLFQDTLGNLYGTTAVGGAYGGGTVFKLPLSGKSMRVLYNFAGGQDGQQPTAGVIQDANGNLYGTTYFGGAANKGTVFEVSGSGKESVLYNFATTGGNGVYPYAGLIRDSYGDLFSTTYQGGTYGYGTVFMVNSSGSEGVIHSFTGGADGANPYGGLMRDAQGNLYGTARTGGANGVGTVFKITP